MKPLEAIAIAAIAGLVVFWLADRVKAPTAPVGDPSIDPATGGVRLPTPVIYGPAAPVGINSNDSSFVNPNTGMIN